MPSSVIARAHPRAPTIYGVLADERGLVRQAQAGCPDAQSRLYEAFYPRLVRYGLTKLRDQHAAEDLASDVIVSILASISRYRPSGAPFAAWVFRIARNRVIDTTRKASRQACYPLVLDVAAEGGVDEQVGRGMAVNEIRRLIEKLSPGQRDTILHLYFGGHNTASTARLIGRSEGAVKSLRFRGLIALRHLMSESRLVAC